jgi:hypothetical protein
VESEIARRTGLDQSGEALDAPDERGVRTHDV